jgi:hypothetical protein
VRRTPLARRPVTVDLVTPAMRLAVLTRDGGCVAVRLGSRQECRGRLTLDHVKDKPKIGDQPVKRRRIRAPSDLAHRVTVCEWHHLYGWATSHRTELRDWIAAHPTPEPGECGHVDPVFGCCDQRVTA